MLLRVAIILLSLASLASGQTTITLRPSARLAEGTQDLRLADIADVSGPDAAALSALTVATDVAKTAGRDGIVPLTLDHVRAALDGQPGVNLGKIIMRGGTCAVRMASAAPAAKSPARAPGRTDRRAEPAAIDPSGPYSIRIAIAQRIAAAHEVDLDAVRVGFDDTDQPTLDHLIGDARADIHFGSSPTSARTPITVTLYSVDPNDPSNVRITLNRTVQADVLVHRSVIVSARAIDRGATLTRDDLVNEPRWAPPERGQSPDIDDLAGLITQRRIAAGQLVTPADLLSPQACKRGDTVNVHCLSGGVVIKIKAKALESARDGELVKLKVEGSDQPFEARMSGRGRAVMDVK